MPIITYNKKEYHARDGETLLDCLLRHGVDVSEPCEDGSCQKCRVKPAASEALQHDGSTGEASANDVLFPCTTIVWDAMAVESVDH